jgi:signal transduction histidine kinase
LVSAGRAIIRPSGISRATDARRCSATYSEIVPRVFERLRRIRIDPLTVDRVLAVAATVLTQLEIWLGGGTAASRVGIAVVTLAITVPIAWRRRYPAMVGAAVPAIGAVAHAYWDTQSVGYPMATFLAMYALAVWTSNRRFVAGLAVVTAADLAAGGVSLQHFVDAAPYTIVTTAVMLLVRRVVRDRERRAQLAERERDITAREAVVAERSRIARELHDVIAHNVSMMVVQAGAERRVLDDASASTRDVLQGIERTGRSALNEMRRLVGMLRSDGSDPLAPQPGLDDLPTLVTQVREAGLPVELQVDGDWAAIPVGIQLSAYRIVQEALTNTLRHARDARASVRIRYAGRLLELEISDDGRAGGLPESSGGHGLVGMRERVALYGGRLSVGPQPGGGFSVHVLLPVQ